MKKTMIIAFAAMIFCPQFASAQFVGMKSSSSAASLSSSEFSSGRKNSFHASYVPGKAVVKDDDATETEKLKGFNVGWDQTNPLGTTGLLFEYGLSMDMGFCSQKEKYSSYSYESNLTLLDLRAPLSIAYAFDIPGTPVGLMPVAGLDLGAYLVGSMKYKTNNGSSTEEETINIFDSDNKARRFIFDFHVGARVLVGENFFVEYRYEGPITKMYSEGDYSLSVRRHNVGFGWFF